MSSWPKILIATTAFCALTAATTLQAQADNGNHNGWSKGDKGDKGDKGGKGGSKGAPGPIAAGLPILLLAGGYALVRRYRRTDEPAERPHA